MTGLESFIRSRCPECERVFWSEGEPCSCIPRCVACDEVIPCACGQSFTCWGCQESTHIENQELINGLPHCAPCWVRNRPPTDPVEDERGGELAPTGEPS